MKKNNATKGEIIIYQGAKKEVKLDVRLKEETVWLSLNQLAALFSTDKSGISRHIKNIYYSKELSRGGTVAKIATVQAEGERQIEREIEYYNLDMILSVGYRVNSKRATQFRIWATKTLKEHLTKGYTVNEKRLLEAKETFNKLQKTVAFIREKSQKDLLFGQSQEILELLADYAKTITLLEQYDAGEIKKIRGSKAKFILKYERCLLIIKQLKSQLVKKEEAGDLFGKERDGMLAGIIKNLYQTFGEKALYDTIESRAAHLLYFIIKDHSFSDGNKRIGSFLFVYFLDNEKYLYRQDGERKINDNALTALALLIAESAPTEKDVIIDIVMSLISE